MYPILNKNKRKKYKEKIMDDILNEFKEYLVKRGYKEFTLSGKPSTVYDYA